MTEQIIENAKLEAQKLLKTLKKKLREYYRNLHF